MAVAKQETHKFDAEISKVLNLVINSLYTNQEIFLRELLSNASDACDKLRYEINSNEKIASKLKDNPLKISVKINEKEKTLEIFDSGIGMDKQDLIENLGTIAKSGTQKFLDSLQEGEKKSSDLIGQFGVGFYASFMVADKVRVISSKAGENKAFKWESEGTGEFILEEISDDIRGTKITLFLKQDFDKFLDKFNVKNIIKTYSDHIGFPIELIAENEEKPEIVNSVEALWHKAKKDISQEEYNSFYKNLDHAVDDAWLTLHNKVEGVIDYTNLLFIPSKRPFDIFHPDRKCSVKLYVKKVFITEDNHVELIPAYLRFLRGIIDSQDLPLNISRETLQNNITIDRIRNSVVKKILAELNKKMENDLTEYEKFWDNFGAVLKEALCEYTVDKDKIFDLCLFKTSKSNGKYISLKQYVARMQKEQKAIYCLIGNDLEAMAENPQIESFKEKDIEILFLTDGVDDFWLTTNPKYQEKDIKSVARSASDLEDESKEKAKEKDIKKEEKNKYEDLLAAMKEALADRIADVKISKKLTSSPACLAVSEHGMDIRMERMLIEQGQLKEASKKILEINPEHKILKAMHKNFQTNKPEFNDYCLVLFDQACIIEGEAIKDPLKLAKRITNLLEKLS